MVPANTVEPSLKSSDTITVKYHQPTSDRTYYPRAIVELTVPVFGDTAAKEVQEAGKDTIVTSFIPRRVTLIRNDHNHADVCKILADWHDAGVDPRFLRNATCKVWIGYIQPHAGQRVCNRSITQSDGNLRFVGVAVNVKRDAGEEVGMEVEMTFHDYTNFFIHMKPYPSDGFPDYSMNLRQCWQTICDNTGYYDHSTQKVISTVSELRDRIEFVGIREVNTALGQSIPARLVKFGAKIQPGNAREDAWAIWQRCVNSIGLISYFKNDTLIITDALGYYSLGDEPLAVWGKNITSISEERNTDHAGKPLMLRSFDPIQATTIESVYPPPSDPTVKKKKVNAKAKHPKPFEASEDQAYEVREYPGISDQHVLDVLCQRVYEESSRQELKGTLQTSDMEMTTRKGNLFSVLDLWAGDVIRIDIEPYDMDRERGKSGGEVQEHLMKRGYSIDMAALIVANMGALPLLRNVYYVSGIEAMLDTDGDNGNFHVQISFLNRIRISGSTDEATRQGRDRKATEDAANAFLDPNVGPITAMMPTQLDPSASEPTPVQAAQPPAYSPPPTPALNVSSGPWI